MRGTGGNRFIDASSSIPDLVAAVERGLHELEAYADKTERQIDLSAISVETRLTNSGQSISVMVTGDLRKRL